MGARDQELKRRMEEIEQEMLKNDHIGEEEFEECMTRLRSLGSCNVGVTSSLISTTGVHVSGVLVRLRLGLDLFANGV